MVWLKTKKKGEFLVKSYSSLANSRVEFFPHNIIWNS